MFLLMGTSVKERVENAQPFIRKSLRKRREKGEMVNIEERKMREAEIDSECLPRMGRSGKGED